jgi:RND family efflux transporter MFP subunit
MQKAWILAALSAMLIVSGCDDESDDTAQQAEPEPRLVRAIKIGATVILGQRQFTGRARAARETDLAFRVSGRLLKREVDVGDIVSEGDVIARLHPSTFIADVTRLEADLAAAEADADAKHQQYGRVMGLVESGTYSEARGDQARGVRDASAALVDSASSALERIRLDLSFTVLTAPFSGRIVSVYAEDFEEVRAQQNIARLLDTTQIEMVVNIPESLISLVPQVESTTVIFDVFPDVELVATIKEIGAEASQTTRTYPVTMIMEQPESVLILPGMSGTAQAREIRSGLPESGIVIPPSAVRASGTGDEGFTVWVVDPGSGSVVLREVETGRVLWSGIQIENGLSEGEWVVTAGVNSLVEGQKVRLPSVSAGADQ